MVEASFGAPRRNMRAAVIAEDFLEAGNDFSRVRVARGNRAARTGVAALEIHFADAEAHGTAFLRAEQLILPERRNALDLQVGAKALARVLELHVLKEIANNLQAGGGNNRWAAGDCVIGKPFRRMAHGDRLLEV